MQGAVGSSGGDTEDAESKAGAAQQLACGTERESDNSRTSVVNATVGVLAQNTPALRTELKQ